MSVCGRRDILYPVADFDCQPESNMSDESLAMMPWFPRDFRSATQHWPPEARAVYRELLDLQWDIGYVPDDPKTIRKTCGFSLKWWRVWEPFWDEKFIVKDGKRINPTLEKHRVKSMILREKRRIAGRKGGEANAKASASSNAEASSSAPSNTNSSSRFNGTTRPHGKPDPDAPLRAYAKERGVEL